MAYNETPFIEYLVSLTPLAVDETALQAILFNRGIEEDIVVGDVELKERELCYADMLMWCADAPSLTGSVSDTDGGWSHKEGGTRMTNAERASLRNKANAIYRKYSEAISSESTIKLHNQGMKLW